MGDDGFINLRVAQNLLDGFGPVFNRAERVEAVTSPLWVALIAAVGVSGLRLESLAVGMSLLLSVLGVTLGALGAYQVAREHDPNRKERPVLALGVLIYALIPVSWDYCTSGLENGLSLAWIGAGYYWMARAGRTPPPDISSPWLFLYVGLGPLIRPELTILSCAWSSLLFLRMPQWRRRVLLAILVLALPVLFQLARMAYFGCLIPNTGIAKEAFDSRWVQGLRFAHNFYGLYWLYASIPLALLLSLSAAVTRPQRALQCFTLASACIYLVYVIRVGGGFMHGRLLLPATFALLLPASNIPLAPSLYLLRPLRRASVLGALPAFAILTLSVYTASTIRVARENEHGIGDERGWYTRMAQHPNPVHAEDYARFSWYQSALRDALEIEGALPEASLWLPTGPRTELATWVQKSEVRGAVVRTAIGIAGFAMGPEIHIIDRLGLSDPVGSRIRIEKRSRPGHEKQLSTNWILQRFSEPHRKRKETTAARHELVQRKETHLLELESDCRLLSELNEATQAPLSLELLARNIGRAFRLTRLRLPPDPSLMHCS